MADYTPGPWSTGHAYRSDAGGNRHPLVIGPNHENPICYFEGNWEDEEANARLIAAAPDLLEAAVNTLDGLLCDELFTLTIESLPFRAAEHRCGKCGRCRLHAAVAKATGESVNA